MTQTRRLIYLFIYVIALLAINYLAFGDWKPSLDGKGIWFYSGLVVLLMGQLLTTPFFTSPANALTYAVSALLVLIYIKAPYKSSLYYFVLSLNSFIVLVSILGIFLKDSKRDFFRKISNTSRIIADSIGNPKIIYISILFYALIEYHKEN